MASLIGGPCFDCADFHDAFAAFIFPWEFSVGNIGFESGDGVGVCGDDEEYFLFFVVDVVPDAFALSIDGVFKSQFGRVHHHFGGVLIELQEVFDRVGIH